MFINYLKFFPKKNPTIKEKTLNLGFFKFKFDNLIQNELINNYFIKKS